MVFNLLNSPTDKALKTTIATKENLNIVTLDNKNVMILVEKEGNDLADRS